MTTDSTDFSSFIPSIHSEPIRFLGRIIDGSISDRKAIDELEKKLLDGLTILDKSCFKGPRPFLHQKLIFIYFFFLCKGFDNASYLRGMTSISSACKSVTANPSITYNFYDLLEEPINTYKFSPRKVWNCDENGFPTDPQRSKVASVKGKTAYKTTSSTNMENITTLSVCNAARSLGSSCSFRWKEYAIDMETSKSRIENLLRVVRKWLDAHRVVQNVLCSN